jgi:hypothetical protein
MFAPNLVFNAVDRREVIASRDALPEFIERKQRHRRTFVIPKALVAKHRGAPHGASEATVSIYVRNLAQLFNSFDPSWHNEFAYERDELHQCSYSNRVQLGCYHHDSARGPTWVLKRTTGTQVAVGIVDPLPPAAAPTAKETRLWPPLKAPKRYRHVIRKRSPWQK